MSVLRKPDNAFLRLVEKLIPLSEKIAPISPGKSTSGVTVVNNHIFAKVFLLDSGYANLKRVDDGLIMATVFAPYILGLSFYPGTEIFYTIELGPHSSLHQLPRIHALNAVKKYDLQREWTSIAAYKIALLYARDRNIVRQRPYEVVCRMLTRLMSLPQFFREHISAIQYIEQRTVLSRSSIQRVLFQLKKNGFIEMKDGKLEKINQLSD